MADIAQIKSDVVVKLKNDVFFSYFKDYPTSIIELAFDNSITEIRQGVFKCLTNLNPYSNTVYFFSCYVAHYLLGFNLVDKGMGNWSLEAGREIPDLFSSVSNMNADGLSVSFESERLGLDISTPFEQWLSSSSFGYRCIQFVKDCTFRKGRCFIV